MNESKEKKYISILGDSISTLEGYSEPDYAVYYEGEKRLFSDVLFFSDTWWGRVCEKFGYELLANNSFAGSTVTRSPKHMIPSFACSDERTSSLGVDNKHPDIIIVFIGVNDWGCGVKIYPCDGEQNNASIFSVAYETMLKKLTKNYPSAKIFCLTLPRCSPEQNEYVYRGRIFKHKLCEYCEAIKLCASRCGCETIDLYEKVESYDSVDGFHPNADGMKTIADAVISALEAIIYENTLECFRRISDKSST